MLLFLRRWSRIYLFKAVFIFRHCKILRVFFKHANWWIHTADCLSWTDFSFSNIFEHLYLLRQVLFCFNVKLTISKILQYVLFSNLNFINFLLEFIIIWEKRFQIILNRNIMNFLMRFAKNSSSSFLHWLGCMVSFWSLLTVKSN